MAMTTERPRTVADLRCPRCKGSTLSNVHDYDTGETEPTCLACGWSGDPEKYSATPEADVYRWVQVNNGGMPIKVPHIARFLGERSTGLLCGKYATSGVRNYVLLADVQRGEQREGACTVCQAIIERDWAGGVVSVESGPVSAPTSALPARAAPTVDPAPAPFVAEPEPAISAAEPLASSTAIEATAEIAAVPSVLDDPLDGFELYTQRSTRFPATVFRATLDRSGNLRLSPAAFAAIGQPETVQLLYHSGRRRIAVRPCEAGTVGALKPRSKRGRGDSYVVSAEGFCKRFGLSTEAARELAVTVLGSVLVLDLEPADVRG